MQKKLCALIVNPVYRDRNQTFDGILKMAECAAASGAGVILFPEAALTGLVNNDDPNHDLPLGVSIPGPITDALGMLCCRCKIWLGIGLLERAGEKLYDSAVLLDHQGNIALKYRRNQPQWHGKHADPSVYDEGTKIGIVTTPIGSVAFLICGDLFDNTIVSRLKALNPDWLFFPFARCFSDGSIDQQRWDTEELPDYAARVALTGTTTLMVNYFADPDLNDGNTFGGAWVINAQGKVIQSYPTGKTGILMVDLFS